LDEPLGALDLKLRQRLQVELSEIHREVGTTFVYVTHDQEEAMSMADRIAVMNHGRIEQLGAPYEIYRRPASRFVADFTGDATFLDVRLEGDVAVLADGTRVPCEHRTGLSAGSLMVRPESLHIAAPDDAPLGAVRGRSLQSSFLGTRLRIAVGTRCSDAPLIVALHGEAPSSAPAEASEVAVWWAPSDAILLPAAERWTRRAWTVALRGRHGDRVLRSRRRGGFCPPSCCSGASSSCPSASSWSTASGRASTTTSSTTGRSTTTDTSSASAP